MDFDSLFFEEFFDVKWAATGQTRKISWSTLDSGFLNLASPPGNLIEASQSSANYLQVYQQAFDLWDAALETISFVRTDDGNAADITVAIAEVDGIGGTKGHWTSSWNDFIINRGTIHFDAADLATTDLLTTALHEIGNILGLGDIQPSSSIQSIQEDNFPEEFTGNELWEYDVNLIQTYYGETTSNVLPETPIDFDELFFEDYFGVKWAATGETRTITWSTLDSGFLNLASPRGSTIQVAQSSEAYVAVYQQAFDIWDAALDTITFAQTNNGNGADVTVAIAEIDGRGGIEGRWTSSWNNFIVNRGTIHFDPDDLASGDLLTTALHEVGNILGLGDIEPNSSFQSVQEDPFPEDFQGTSLGEYDTNLIRSYYGESTSPSTPILTDETFMLSIGDERLNGFDGIDTVVLPENSTNFSIQATAGSAELVLADRNGIGGTDRLLNMDVFQFADRTLELKNFSSALSLSSAQFTELAEMYVAYFNRAADAIGLYFWADQLAEGFTLDKIAEEFFDQNETRALYPDPSNTDAFISAVYANVLGRAPDAKGFAFWQDVVARDAVSEGAFVLEIIKGAKAGDNVGDVAYLAAKADLGIYFSVIKGMSDTSDAAQVMEVFGDQVTSDTAGAIAAADGHFEDATEQGMGDFLVTLVGVVDDPFIA